MASPQADRVRLLHHSCWSSYCSLILQQHLAMKVHHHMDIASGWAHALARCCFCSACEDYVEGLATSASMQGTFSNLPAQLACIHQASCKCP